MFRETSFGDVEQVKHTLSSEEVRSPGHAGGRGRNAWQHLEMQGFSVTACQLTDVLTRSWDALALRWGRWNQAARTGRVGCPWPLP